MTIYRIVVSSELTERYAPAFEGMNMEAKSGRTILTGEIVDQAHLHGILNRVNRLGLALVSVETGFPAYQGHGANRPSAADQETRRGLES
jgi:hypothetical protein